MRDAEIMTDDELNSKRMNLTPQQATNPNEKFHTSPESYWV